MSERVSIVIVNWNGAEDLEVALPSLRAQSYPDLEIVVADNGSIDDSEQVARAHEVVWHPLGENRGLAPALNEGARRARGDVLLFLNNDMRFAPDYVERAVEVLLSDRDIAAVGTCQLDWDGNVGVHERTRLRPARWPRGDVPGWEFAQEPASAPCDCLFASAADLLIRRVDFEALGGWDDAFTLSWEDVDLCWRIWAAGHRVVHIPDAICWHRVAAASTATDDGSDARLHGTLYGRLRFAWKHLPAASLVVLHLLLIAGIVTDMVRSRSVERRARTHVLGRVMRELPKLVRVRREHARPAGRSRRAFLRRLGAI
ncbi:MAG: glycosyltransferase family 2 protein [Acidimicrobiia bacterium]